ncbi:MAG: hypothetical protein AAF608_08875 [Pseudomonadota bacterium]
MVGKSRLQWVVLAFLLASCGSTKLGQDFSFEGSNDEALIAMDRFHAAPSLAYGLPDTALIRRVDLDEKTFVSGDIRIVFGNFGRILSYPDGDGRLGLNIRRVPLGDYAWVGHDTVTQSGNLTTTRTNCYSEGALVFRLQPGAVNVVEVAPINLPDAPTMSPTAERLPSMNAAFPNIAGGFVMAPAVAKITFERGSNFLTGSDCPKGDVFNVVERALPDAAP